MADPDKQIRFELTPEQQQMVEKLTGRKSDSLHFTISELEQRIAPMGYPQFE